MDRGSKQLVFPQPAGAKCNTFVYRLIVGAKRRNRRVSSGGPPEKCLTCTPRGCRTRRRAHFSCCAAPSSRRGARRTSRSSPKCNQPHASTCLPPPTRHRQRSQSSPSICLPTVASGTVAARLQNNRARAASPTGAVIQHSAQGGQSGLPWITRTRTPTSAGSCHL